MKVIIIYMLMITMSFSTLASDEHDHIEGENTNNKQKVNHQNDEHDHEEEHNHGNGHSDKNGHDDESEHEDEHDHGHGGGKAIGEGKAIVDVDEKKGFKLSPEAIKTIGLKLETVSELSIKISKDTLVASKGLKGIYRFKDGYFKFISVQIKKETKDGYLIEVSELAFGDQIVVDGVGLLRVADVYSTDKSEYGHGH